MKLSIAAVVAILLSASQLFAQQPEDPGKQLARAVWQASGGQYWSKVKELHFTFIVEQDGKQLVSAEHKWDLAAGTDRVKWKGKDVTVNLAAPAQDEDGQAAYGRWVNDSYWLLAPLKILDGGVKVAYEDDKEIDGVWCETLRLSFAQVGLTPSDVYVLYIDPQTNLVRAWDYIPKEGTVMHGTWENYETFGGLKLATKHNFEGKVIRFADIKVVARD
jgi:hypothetical protein